MRRLANLTLTILFALSTLAPPPVLAQVASETELGKQIESLKGEIDGINKKVQTLNLKLEEQRVRAKNLRDELAILDKQVEALNLSIELTKKQIEQVGLEIAGIEEQIRTTEAEIQRTREQLAVYIRSLWRIEQTSPLEVIFLHPSLSEVFSQMSVLTSLQDKVSDKLTRLKTLRERQEHERQQLEAKRRELDTLRLSLESDRGKSEAQGSAKKVLLEETRSSEAVFRKFIQDLQAEQSEINSEIVRIDAAIRKRRAERIGPVSFVWPVPNRGITTIFRDPSYPFRRFFEHDAIDIRSPQGSPVKATSEGEVAIAKNAGRGYSYILIVHDNGYSTLYGHVSKIFVTPGQTVNQGDIIALSGGLPGTAGAGRLTTGPHLHLEVRKDGAPIDPSTVLP